MTTRDFTGEEFRVSYRYRKRDQMRYQIRKGREAADQLMKRLKRRGETELAMERRTVGQWERV